MLPRGQCFLFNAVQLIFDFQKKKSLLLFMSAVPFIVRRTSVNIFKTCGVQMSESLADKLHSGGTLGLSLWRAPRTLLHISEVLLGD